MINLSEAILCATNKEKTMEDFIQRISSSIGIGNLIWLVLFVFTFYKHFYRNHKPFGVVLLIWLAGILSPASSLQVLWGFPGIIVACWLFVIWEDAIIRTGSWPLGVESRKLKDM